MSIDTTKLGVVTAKAMEQIENLYAAGDIADDAEVGAVVIVVALDSKTPDDHPERDNMRDVATQCFCFTEPDQLYVQLGLLEMARTNYEPDVLANEDE